MINKECKHFDHLYCGLWGCVKDYPKTIIADELHCQDCENYNEKKKRKRD